MKALASWIPMVMQIGGKCDGQREGHSEGMVVNDIALGKERSVAIVAALFFRVVLCILQELQPHGYRSMSINFSSPTLPSWMQAAFEYKEPLISAAITACELARATPFLQDLTAK
mmetsp:Transcript_23284/g.33316  ORF Transcript_23284/g.33316 Transcript_23284/m.33316 type:complete len:115 (-) Transcript_23284:315-659(-)